MEEQIIKNRYLQLDGTPIESKEWRRYINPLTFAASITGASIGCALPQVKTELAPTTLFMIAVSGIAARGMTRQTLVANFSKAGLGNFVVDTTPEIKKHSCTEAELNSILSEIKEDSKTSYTASGAIASSVGISTYLFAVHPAYQALAIQLALLPSALSSSFEGYSLAKKIQKNEWVIIGRGEMQADQVIPATPQLT